MVVIIDYGMGNLRSVCKALETAGERAKISSKPEDIIKAEKIVLPGVGSFGEAMRELKRRRLVGPMKDAIAAGRYFLGLCLGLQLLFEKSQEAPGVKGLGVLRGEVKRFRVSGIGYRESKEVLKVPHMGWNQITRSTPVRRSLGEGGIHDPRSTKILKGVPDGSYMYFVHSYYAVPKDKGDILTTTDYGINFASSVSRDNVYAFQFHPEKSQGLGLKILKNFVRL